MAVRNVRSNQHVTCFVHSTVIPRATAHEHHEAPRAAGGGDTLDNLVWLCANCHQLSHRVAQLRQLGKSAEAEDITQSSFGQPAMRARFLQVVSEVVNAHENAEQFGLGKPTAEVMIDLDHTLYAYLKQLASEHKHANRKVGVARYISAVLHKHAVDNGFLPPSQKTEQFAVAQDKPKVVGNSGMFS